jgi:WD40 repeat protein
VSVFEVAIGPDASAGTFRVEVVSSPDGGLAAAVAGLDVPGLLARRRELEHAVLISGMPLRTVYPEEQQVRQVGRALFETLLGTGEVAGRYRAAAAVAAERGEGLRVVLRIGDPALSALPWEAMYDDAAGRYVCRREPLVRNVGIPAASPSLAVDLPLRVLGIVSAPRDLPSLNVPKEQQQLARALRPLTDRGLAGLTWAPSATWADLQDQLQSGTWHVVHFIGHGGFDAGLDEGVIALEDEDGVKHLVEAGRFIDLLGSARPMPRLVVLNSCSGAAGSAQDLFAGTAAALVRGGAGAVVAMQYEISDPAATAFSRGFYGAVARGRAVDEAASSGRTAILGLSGRTLEWVTPVLYLRGAESRLFEVQQTPGVKQAPAVRQALEVKEELEGEHPRKTWRPPSPDAREAPTYDTSGSGLRPMLRARVVRTIDAHLAGVHSVSFSPDGGLLASAGSDGAVRLWDTATGTEVASAVALGPRVSRVAYSPLGDQIASCWSDGTVRLLMPPTTQQLGTRDEAANYDVQGRPLSRDDIDVLRDELARLYGTEPRAGTFLRAVGFPATSIPDWRDPRSFWADIFLQIDSGVMPNKAPYRRLVGVALLTYSSNGRLAAIRSSQPVQSAAPMRTRFACTHVGGALSVAFSTDGGNLVSAGHRGNVCLHRRSKAPAEELLRPSYDTQALAFSPDGSLLATGQAGGHVGLLTVDRPGRDQTAGRHQAAVTDVAFNPDGTLLASGSLDGTVRLLQVARVQPARSLTSDFGRTYGVDFSWDGALLAAATDRGVVIWDTASNSVAHAFSKPQAEARDVAFAPGSYQLAAAYASGDILLWE